MSDGAAAAPSMPDCAEAEPAIAAGLFGERLPLARRYAELLVDVAIPRGLLGPREAGRVWSRHLVNSAALAEALPESAHSVVDLGSGAGLPGIPLALARPDLQVTLLEPMLRRVEFLRECVETLGLPVEVARARAEDYTGPRADVAVARALAPLDRLLAMAAHVVHPAGVLVALKGRSVADELAAASATARAAGIDIETLALSADPDGTVMRATWSDAKPGRRAGRRTSR